MMMVCSMVFDQTKVINKGRRFFGGLTNTFSISQFEVSVHIEFVKQLSTSYFFMFDQQPGGFDPLRSQGNQFASLLFDSWQKPGSIVSVQKLSQSSEASQAYGKITASDFAARDASFVRIKNVSIAY